MTPGAWHDSHWNTKFKLTGMTTKKKAKKNKTKKPVVKAEIELRPAALEPEALPLRCRGDVWIVRRPFAVRRIRGSLASRVILMTRVKLML